MDTNLKSTESKGTDVFKGAISWICSLLLLCGLTTGLLVLLFDMAKGFGAVYLGQWIMGPLGAYLGALCAVAGHNWPIYLKFKGGKGVATTVGVMLAFVPYITLIAMACFLVVLAVSRYFSLGSLVCLGLVWVLVMLRV